MRVSCRDILVMVYESAENPHYWIAVSDEPDEASQGDTKEEAIESLCTTILLIVETMEERGTLDRVFNDKWMLVDEEKLKSCKTPADIKKMMVIFTPE